MSRKKSKGFRGGPRGGQGRVAPGIAPWRSRRSVRAQFGHTARPAMVSQAATLSMGVKVTASSRHEVLVRVPTDHSTTRHPLRSPGSARLAFPCFHASMRCSDSLQTFPPRFVCASLGGTTPCACLRRSTQTRRRSGAWSFAVWQLRASSYRDGVAGPPRFLDNPDAATPCSSTPAGPDTPCPSGVPMLPPCCQKRRLQRVVLSRLNRTALLLAVYASSWPLRNPDARLASGCWLGFTGRDWLPAGLLRKVSEISSSSFPKLFLAQ
jgi:hypothetical protein